MKEKPILFSGPMVRAILEGRKTMTRRVMKVQPLTANSKLIYCVDSTVRREAGKHHFAEVDDNLTITNSTAHFSAYAEVGDRLWVREAHWRFNGRWSPKLERDGADTWPRIGGEYFEYDTNEDGQLAALGWSRCPSIFMPRWASRITLEITGVRVERLQDISEDDAKAEGMKSADFATGRECILDPAMGSYRLTFRHGWDRINGKRPGCAWKDNPWVWVIEFKKLEVTTNAAAA